MVLLAFETSAKAASVALFRDEVLLGESYQNTGLTHSQTLMVMAEDMLKQCSLSPREVTHVAVAAGPGSFTGVRIGVAAAKGFAWANGLPCYGVSTLESMALGLGAYEGIVCPVMDARREQVYNALFKAERGRLTRLTEDRAISLVDLGRELAQWDAPIFLVGDGSLVAERGLQGQKLQLVLPVNGRMHQRAVGVAYAVLAHPDAPCDAASLQPNYLRLSQAEREKLERQQC